MTRTHVSSSLKIIKMAVLLVPFLVVVLGITSLISGPARASAASPAPRFATVFHEAAINNNCTNNFFGLVPWYKYMPDEFFSPYAPADSQSDPCSVKCFNFFNQSVPNDCGQTDSDVPGVLLAITDDMLRVAGLIAIAFVLVGSFQFITSQGKPDDTAKARSTIINALIGLATAMVAIAFVSFIGNKVGG